MEASRNNLDTGWMGDRRRIPTFTIAYNFSTSNVEKRLVLKQIYRIKKKIAFKPLYAVDRHVVLSKLTDF